MDWQLHNNEKLKRPGRSLIQTIQKLVSCPKIFSHIKNPYGYRKLFIRSLRLTISTIRTPYFSLSTNTSPLAIKVLFT